MAGFYPDSAGPRQAYDLMNCNVVRFQLNSHPRRTIFTQPTIDALNSEDQSGAGAAGESPFSSNQYRAILFPELWDLDGCYLQVNGGRILGVPIETSVDTTNGQDGVWVNRVANLVDGLAAVHHTYRGVNDGGRLYTFAAPGVRGIRARWDVLAAGITNPTVHAWHIYGEPAAGQTPDRLIFLDSTTGLVEFTGPVDYGDVPRGQVVDRTLRVNNTSGARTANGILLSFSDLSFGSTAWYTIDLAGSGFGVSQTIASLAPGANSGLITIRRDIADNADMGKHAARLMANPTSWTP